MPKLAIKQVSLEEPQRGFNQHLTATEAVRHDPLSLITRYGFLRSPQRPQRQPDGTFIRDPDIHHGTNLRYRRDAPTQAPVVGEPVLLDYTHNDEPVRLPTMPREHTEVPTPILSAEPMENFTLHVHRAVDYAPTTHQPPHPLAVALSATDLQRIATSVMSFQPQPQPQTVDPATTTRVNDPVPDPTIATTHTAPIPDSPNSRSGNGVNHVRVPITDDTTTLQQRVTMNPAYQDVFAGRTPQPMTRGALSANPEVFEWNGVRERAALLLADGFTKQTTAQECDIAVSTITGWTTYEPFRQRVQEYRDSLRQLLLAEGIAVKEFRVRQMSARHELLQRVIDARALTHAGDPNAPEAATGLFAREQQVIGSGNNAREVTRYRLDKDLLSEFRSLERAAAEELGQVTKKSEITVAPKAYVGVDIDAV